MPKFEIKNAGLLTTVQDLGRRGLAYYAMPQSGVMDAQSARVALLLLRLPEHYPLLECTAVAPQLYFHDATELVVSGANFNWQLDGVPLSLNEVTPVSAGQLLKGQVSRTGLRGYIAINGLLKVEELYGSAATYLPAGKGGYHGRALKKGDQLSWEAHEPLLREVPVFELCEGPEFQHLTEASKQRLQQEIFRIGRDSNRMGARLEGPVLESSLYQLSDSRPVLPGFVQLPPGGQPIVVLQDGQRTGGYPRIAYLPEEQLGRFNQVPLGGALRFRL